MNVRRSIAILALTAPLLVACAGGGSGQTRGSRDATKKEASAHDQVVATERAFAKTMADRNFKSFQQFLSSEAIFFSGSTVEHGPEEIEAAWKPYFKGAAAPFSWVPDNVQVVRSGKLALSTGPVYVDGKEVGRFNSIWRLESTNTWRIVFDKGEAVCSAKP
jgi:ketosteroid isomerase-like protein